LNIWLIQTGEPLPFNDNVRKMRAALLAEKLIDRGHDVLWWTSAFDHFKKEWIFNQETEYSLIDNLKIIVLKGTGYKKNISLSRFLDHRIIASRFKEKAPQMPKPDIIITSLPPHDLAYEAVDFAKLKSIPVIVDIRDPWPDIFLSHVPKRFRKLVKLLLFKDFQMIIKTFKDADCLLAVTKSFLDWGLKYADRKITSKDNIFYLGSRKINTSEKNVLPQKFETYTNIFNGKYIIFFIGSISASYHNPSILLKVAEKLRATSDIHFIIAGDGDLLNTLKEKSTHLDNVTLTGWLNDEEISFILRHAKIGICPANKFVEVPTNKAYTYLSAGLPIISAFHGSLEEIIEEHQIGFSYPPNDVDALVNCIKKLHDDSEFYKGMSENAERVFDEMFDADNNPSAQSFQD
jgi:glycosyltransferase involved in cell wall biosynthesis